MRIIRWQEPEAPREQTIWKLMQREGLRPYSWSNGPGVTYAVHSHSALVGAQGVTCMEAAREG